MFAQGPGPGCGGAVLGGGGGGLVLKVPTAVAQAGFDVFDVPAAAAAASEAAAAALRTGASEGQLVGLRLLRPSALSWCTVIAFDSSGWHTSGRCRTPTGGRRSCYSLYRERSGSLTKGRNPTWPAPGGTRVGIPEQTLRRLDGEGKLEGYSASESLAYDRIPDTGTGTA